MFFFSSRRRHTRSYGDWSSDVCSSDLVRKIEEARELGIDTQIKKISFEFVMDRMRKLIYTDIDQIREGLSNSKNIDYYYEPAEFIAPYTMRVRGTEIKSKMIFLCIGSKTII